MFWSLAIAFVVAAHTCNALVMCTCMLAPIMVKEEKWLDF
ncbi:hypothetical protein H4W29_001058 [Rhizobium viscosum]|uniref:Uncharacterized protein n=1 Tax=Rhizobium viscosum TaxID=1673 RepID=A0ABR9IL27_RHIVS|nr:hypothetical protein [Rhizobium viscosum]